MKDTTRPRGQQIVLDYLQQLTQPISAQNLYVWLHKEGKKLGLATVYRSLEALKREGLVCSRISPDGEALHSLVREGQQYFTCIQCGDSLIVGASHPDPNLLGEISKDLRVIYHTLEFFGVCQMCQHSP